MTTRHQVNRAVRKGGLSYAEPDMDYAVDDDEEEDDLSDLLDEDPEEEEEEDDGMGDEFPPEAPEDDESEIQLAMEIDNLYKQVDNRDQMILQLAKGVRTIAKRLVALEDNAPESDFNVGGDDDLGEPEAYADGEENEPGLTAGEPQGIAENKALRLNIAKRLAKAGVSMRTIVKSTGLIRKDDKWSNFGEKDAEIPANAPVTPDTKDWAEDLSVVPGSGQAPDSVKGIGSVSKALGIPESTVAKALVAAGLIKKAAPRTVGTPPPTAGAPGINDIEQKARDMSFHDLNQLRIAAGDL